MRVWVNSFRGQGHTIIPGHDTQSRKYIISVLVVTIRYKLFLKKHYLIDVLQSAMKILVRKFHCLEK